MATITGTSLDDVLATTAAVDILSALNGNDVVLVAAAADHGAGETLDGGGGFDRLWFTSASGGETLVLRSTVTGFEAALIADAVGNGSGGTMLHLDATAVAAALLLAGNAGANSITGTAKDDLIIAGEGQDTVAGGAGNDRILMDVSEPATDAIDAGAQSEGNTLVLFGAAADLAVIDLSVAAGADQLLAFGAVADAPVQSDFSHVDASGLTAFGVRITGSAGRNILGGTALDDVFVVANSLHYISTDVVNGGLGDDVLRFASTTAGQTLLVNANLAGVERAEIADATGDASGATTLSINAAAAKSKLVLAGNEGSNTLTGTAFDDTLIGNGGADSLAGGKGNDLYLYDDASDGAVGERITDVAGTDDNIAFTGAAGTTLVLGATMTGVEGIWATGLDSTGAAFDIEETTDRNIDGSALPATLGMRFHGNAGANALTGGKGKDTLAGNDGVDTIVGGLGADLVEMDVDAASIDVIDAGEPAEGNTLRLVGTATDVAVIDLSVAAGADQLLELNGGAEAAVQSDFTHVDASSMEGAGVSITGSALANTLVGSAEQDVFVVLSSLHFLSADRIDGGGEDDLIRFASATAGQVLVVGANVVGVEAAEIADATGDATGTTGLGINAATHAAAIKLSGNDGRNTLTGGAGDDTLVGNGDADTLTGGPGNDTYRYDSAADFAVGEKIVETSGTADVLLFASMVDGEILTLPSSLVGIEQFILDEPEDDTIVGANIGIDASALKAPGSFLGNEGDNTITGTKFADSIDGGKGADSVMGGLGADTIRVSVDAGDEDEALAGASYAEGDVLALFGESAVGVAVDLTVAFGTDQASIALVQSGFAHVDGSGLSEAGLTVFGSGRGERMKGGAQSDFFFPGLGTDTVEGGGEDDYFVVTSQAELGSDVYTDSGGTLGDYLYFDNPNNGATLTIKDSNVNGVDAAAASILRTSTVNLNINASGVGKPFGLAGNAGRNVLTATANGESIFDYGGADTMIGGGGDDDYVIIEDWVHGGSGVGDRITDASGLRDDLYNATDAQVIIVNPAMVTGIERFVVSSEFLAMGGDYVRDIEVFNDAGFDLNLWGKPTHLAGSFGDNYLRATKYNDTIIGHKGLDTVIGGQGTDLIVMEVGEFDIDEIDAGAYAENNQLVLTGELEGFIVIDLGVPDGDDQITWIDGPEPLVQSGFRHVDASGVEDAGVGITGSAAINTLVGTAQDDVLDGRGGADKVFGGAGNDALVVGLTGEFVAGELYDGGEGEDTLRFASTVAGQTLTTFADRLDGIEIVAITDPIGDPSGMTALNVNAASYDAALEIVGNFGDNSLIGTAFADTITGSWGADTLRGNAGNDVYTAFAPGEVMAGDSIIDTGGSADLFRFTSETDGQVVVLTGLMTGLEIAELANDDGELTELFDTGIDASAVPARLALRGNDGDNTLIGTAFDDALDGNLGRDDLQGGAGADTITMAVEPADIDDVDGGDIGEGNLLVLLGDPGGDMVWDLTSGADQLVSVGGADEGRIVRGITHLDASGLASGAVTITGSAEANTLLGTSSGDLFLVLAAAHFAPGEEIDGGGGTDTLRFTSTTGGETLVLTNLVTGVELVQISDAAGMLTGTTVLGLNAALVAGALEIQGNDGANAITGTAFADTIAGGGGADTIVAGAGADKITIQMSAGSIDAANAGLASEGNRLVLAGAAAGTVVVDLSSALDQILSVNAVAEPLAQTGFAHLDASAMTGGGVSVTGSAAGDTLIGTAMADTIDSGAGDDTIGFNIGGGSDAIDAGDAAEGNTLVLTGSAAGTVVLDLSAAGDQLLSINAVADGTVQSGFAHLDASAMSGTGLSVTGSAQGNFIAGSDEADTIDGGAGADRIAWDAGTTPDTIDAGGPGEGDVLVLVGSAAGMIELDFSVAPGSDQLLSIGGAAEAAVQANFQHLDAGALDGSGVQARGNGLNNTFIGSAQADDFTGLAGSDSFWLGGGAGPDESADRVLYESRLDGVSAAGAQFSFDRIREFTTGVDTVAFTGAFHGGPNDLDDMDDDDEFQFAADEKADFALEDEALVITAAVSKLKGETVLGAGNFGAVVKAINKVGVVASAGDDGLIVVQTTASAGVYYYQESDGIANKVSAGELTLLGVFDANLDGGDLAFL
jgi:Ca2+-binding RTX toxin-like protein